MQRASELAVYVMRILGTEYAVYFVDKYPEISFVNNVSNMIHCETQVDSAKYSRKYKKVSSPVFNK